jgi:hypothetical protein
LVLVVFFIEKLRSPRPHPLDYSKVRRAGFISFSHGT